MTRFTACSSTLFALVAVAGCGDGESPTAEAAEDGGAGGQEAPIAEGGAGSGGAEASQWLYATDDEGVFPKDRVLDIQVTMPEEAWNELIATARDEVWSTASVTIDGQNVGDVGFRPKGEYSLDTCVDDAGQLTCDKLSFKIKFSEVDPEGRFYGLKRLVLNQISDPWSLYPETLAYQIFNDFGIVAPRTSYAVLTVNGESLGIYRVVEVVDGRFTDRHFRDGSGNLYKEAWPDREDEGAYTETLETNEDTASNEAILAFAADMLAATDEELPGALGRHMDLAQVLDYMAVDYAIANWDGITTFYAGSWGSSNHNYYLYQNPGTGTFTLIPWDLNAVFFLDHWLGELPPWDTLDVDCDTLIPADDGDNNTIPAACDPTIRAIALSKDGYHASVRRLLDEVFVVDRLSQQIDGYMQQLAPALEDDPFITYREMAEAAAWVKGSLFTLRSRLEAVLGETDTGTGSAGEVGTGGANGADNDAAQDSGSVELPPGTPCELLCSASSGLDCYDEGSCVTDCETELVAPLGEGCSDVHLRAYAACLLGEDEPTVCTDGNLMPNLGVCLDEFNDLMACAGGG